jgi:putative transposase
MPSIIEVRKTYKYRLYRSRRDFRLHDQINIAGIVWNHVTALQKRYYHLFGKHISENRMKKHIAKLRMQTEKYAYWRKLGSQAVQDIIERHEKAYQRFFAKEGGLPRFKKVKRYSSFTLKQAGWKLHDETPTKQHRKISIGKTNYKFVYHRPLQGDIKTVTIKRDAVGNLWLCFSVVEKMAVPDKISTGQIGGFDFGLKTFLTTNTGHKEDAPEFFKQDLPRLRQIQKQVSKKSKCSENQYQGKRHLARRHIRISDKRLNFHFQLAHDLCDQYDTLVFEDLSLAGMKRLWGRKVSDLGFAQFIKILQWVAFKRGKEVLFIDRWERTTGKCSTCGCKQKLELKDRVFECTDCGIVLDRDHNAALNILEAGHRLILSQSIEDSGQQSIRR